MPAPARRVRRNRWIAFVILLTLDLSIVLLIRTSHRGTHIAESVVFPGAGLFENHKLLAVAFLAGVMRSVWSEQLRRPGFAPLDPEMEDAAPDPERVVLAGSLIMQGTNACGTMCALGSCTSRRTGWKARNSSQSVTTSW